MYTYIVYVCEQHTNNKQRKGGCQFQSEGSMEECGGRTLQRSYREEKEGTEVL